VDDAALSLLHTLESPLPKVHRQVFNVGSDEQNFTIQQIGELIKTIVPGAELINQGLGCDRRDYRADFRKIREALGFVPRWSVVEGINQVIDVIRSGEVKDYRSAKYSNVKYLTEQEDAVSLVRNESNWAYDLVDLVKRTSLVTSLTPIVSVAA